MTIDTPGMRALADAEPKVFWLDRSDLPEPSPPPPSGRVDADLCVVGGGYTGLWAAIQAKELDPDRDVVVLEGDRVAHGASGRNGGFLDASVTHGLANGLEHFPGEIERLLAIGRDNYRGILTALDAYRIDAAFEATGELVVATDAYQVPGLAESAALRARYGEDAVLLDRDEVRAEVDSPRLLGGVWQRSHIGLVDPVALALGLRRAADALGVRIFENARATRVSGAGSAVRIDTATGHVEAAGVILATNAFRGLVAPIRRAVATVYDYVLVTEPLSEAQRASIGWKKRQGLADSANQFHYFRLTADDRILWGGYDAVYYYGGRVSQRRDQRPRTMSLLAEQFFDLFPQLEGVRFTHQWGGPIATTSRFCASFGTALEGRLAYSVGYTGLGVAASRFGARVALTLLDDPSADVARLDFVRSRPFPFPPEPLRWLGITLTRRAIARADRREGRRGAWLSLLDRLGLGFDS
ncbi:MAG: FAD-binding oxidoreductase [Acidimicrobiia bacterium]|nr:FAD-binding oxidoreductase [Acidimicrobiia bacterium]